MVDGKAFFFSQAESCVDEVSYAVELEFDAAENPLIIYQIETVNQRVNGQKFVFLHMKEYVSSQTLSNKYT